MGSDARRQTRLKVMNNTLAVVAFFCFLLKAAAAKTPSQECELVFKERLACWWKPCLTKQGLATSGQQRYLLSFFLKKNFAVAVMPAGGEGKKKDPPVARYSSVQ